jgi:hypothetical protein
MGMICSRWASLKQNALFISVLTCYSPLSTAVTNPLAGIVSAFPFLLLPPSLSLSFHFHLLLKICESRFGWPMVYYVHAVACLCLFLLWLLFYNDHPARNHFVVDQELEKIHRGKSRAHINMDRHVPYRVREREREKCTLAFQSMLHFFLPLSLVYTVFLIVPGNPRHRPHLGGLAERLRRPLLRHVPAHVHSHLPEERPSLRRRANWLPGSASLSGPHAIEVPVRLLQRQAEVGVFEKSIIL